MSGVYGRKVREPKVTLRTRQPFPKSGSQARDLEKAWSTFGEAKDILQRIESGQHSPLVDKTRSKAGRVVKFTPDEVDRGARKTFRAGLGSACDDRGLPEEHEERNDREGEYFVKPASLNMGHHHHENREFPYTNGANSYAAGATRYAPGIVNTTRPMVSSSSYLSSGCHNTHSGSPSSWNPRTVYSHGSWQLPSATTLNGAEQLPRTSTSPYRPRPRSPSTLGTTIASSTLPCPSTSPYAHSISQGTTPSSAPQPRRRAWESPHLAASRMSPRSYNEENEERLASLRASVEGQKKAVAAAADRVSSLQQQRLLNKPGFFPLSEGSVSLNSTPSYSTDPAPNHVHPHPHTPTSHYTRHKYTYTLQPSSTTFTTGGSDAPPTKRKVTYAPPPSSYTGFSTSTERTRKTHFAPTHTHPASSVPSRGTVPHWKEGENRAPLASSVGVPKVRKVHRMCTACADANEDPLNTAGLITTSSWRSGKNLAEKILKPGGESKAWKEQAPEKMAGLDPRAHSPLANSVHSFDQDSIECEFNQDPLSTRPSARRDRDRGSGLDHPREHSHCPTTVGNSKKELGRGASSSSSLLGTQAAQLSSDMRQLMEELKVSPPLQSSSPGHCNVEEEGKEGERQPVITRLRRDERRGRVASANKPVTKKPKFGSEPVYPAVKVRHYDQAEVQSYIQQKKAERRKRTLQEQESNEQETKHREKKLKHLYETQRRRVESNLRFKQWQREDCVRTSPTSAAVHIRIQTTPELESNHDPLSTHYLSSAWNRSPVTTHTKAIPLPQATPSATLRPSPPTHPPLSSHSLSPQYSSHYITPLHNSRLAGSPRDPSHSISASSSLRTNHRSPLDRTSPRERTSLTVPVSHCLTTHTSTRLPTYVRYDISHATVHSPSLSDASHYTGTKFTTPPKGALLSYSPSPLQGKTREERIEAITNAALALKEKIVEQSRRLEERPGHMSSMKYRSLDPEEGQSSWSMAQRDGSGGSCRHNSLAGHCVASGFVSQELPGVKGLQEHALQSEKARQENEAAAKIQAVYRGYCVRKSLQWELPTRGTLGEVMQGGRKGGDGVEEEEENAASDEGTLTPSVEGGFLQVDACDVIPSNAESQKDTSATLMHQHCKPTQTAVPVVSTEPWKRDGGDSHSVINVFTRKHQQEWDCKNVVSVGGGSQNGKAGPPRSGMPPCNTASPLSSASRGSGSLSYSGSFEDGTASPSAMQSSSSVSYAAGEMTGKSIRKEGDCLGVVLGASDLSDQCSRDSLLSDVSPVQKTPVSSWPTVTSTKQTLTPSDTRSPANRAMANTEGRRLEVNEDAGVSAITPGSPSFVESFTDSYSRQRPIRPLPSYGTGGGDEDSEEPTAEKGGRFSPRSLELKLLAELSHWEVVTETVGHMTELERARAIARAQQAATDVAQMLKSQQPTREKEMENMSSKMMQDRRKDMEATRKHRDKAIQVSLKEERKVNEEVEKHMREQSTRLSHIEEQSNKAILDLAARLHEVRSRTHVVSGSSVPVEQMISADMVRGIAESAATAATREAVSVVLEGLKPLAVPRAKTRGTSEKYYDDFEAVSSSIPTESGVITEPSSGGRRVEGGVMSKTDSLMLMPLGRDEMESEVSEELEEEEDKEESDIMERLQQEESEVVGEEKDKEESDIMEQLQQEESEVVGEEEEEEESEIMEQLQQEESEVVGEEEEEETDVAEELEEEGSERDGMTKKDRRRTISDVVSETESVEGDIDKVSFRELLPSETHRRHRHRTSKPPTRQYSHSRTSSVITASDFDGRLSSVSPPLVDGSRPLTPALSEVSVLSPSHDSFFHFMSRMMCVYMEEEEVRAKHQSALLQLREDAIKERTKAELEWLKLRERELRDKGADEQMPPLKKREKGLLKKLQQEQVEIQTLKQVQAAARQERKMLMMQHKDISKMRRSTQFYRQKIHKYRHHAKTSTPTPEQNQDGHETRPSLDGSRISPGVDEDHLAYSGVLSDIDQRSSMIPSENLDDSFLSYMHLKADLSSSMTEALERTGSSSKSTLSTSNTHLARSSGSTISTSPLKTPSESVTETSLKLSPRDSASSLAKREQHLMKCKQAAEEKLQQQKLLLQTEHEFGRQEESMDSQKTLQTYQQGATAHEDEEGRGEDLSITEEILSASQSSLMAATDTSSVYKMEIPLVHMSSISEQIVTSPSITEVMSDEFLTSQSLRNQNEGSSRIPSEYALDTFESLDASASFARTAPLPSHPVYSSTPASDRAPSGHRIDQEKDDTEESIHAMSEGLSDSISITSDGSAIEARICMLKKQLHQRQEEVKRVTNERNRRRKERLRIQEERLLKQLEAVESKVIQMKSSHSPIYSGPTSATHSRIHSDVSDIELPSRPESVSPDKKRDDEKEDKSMFGTEGKMQDKPPSEDEEDVRRSGTSSGKRSGTRSPVEEGRMSLPSISSYYTSYTESVESRTSEALLVEIDVESGEDLQPEEALTEDKFMDGVAVGGVQEEKQEDESFERESEHAGYVEEDLQEEGNDEDEGDVDSSVHYDLASSFEGEQEGINVSEDVEGEQEGVNVSEDVEGEQEGVNVSEDVAPVGSTGKLPLPLGDDDEAEQELHPEHSILLKSENVLISTTSSLGGDLQELNGFQVGNHVLIGNKMIGIIRYIGQTHFAAGIWVGVEIGEPKGRNDGSIDEQRYFTCDPLYGLFAPPHKLTLVDVSDAGSSVSDDISEHMESDVEGVEQTSQVEDGNLELDFSKQEIEKREDEDTLEKQEEVQEEEEEYKMTGLFVDASLIQQEEEEESRGDLKRDGKSLSINVSTGSLISEDLSQLSSCSSFSYSSMEQAEGASPSSNLEEQAQEEKHNGFSLAPEIVIQQSQSATATLALPPEFTEESSRESSSEPQSAIVSDTHKMVPLSERNSISNRLSDELVLDLTNEAYETMQRIRCEKKNHLHHHDISEEGKEERGEDMVRGKTSMARKEAFRLMSMEEKAELITDQLMSVLLKSESHFACDMHASKRISSTEGTLDEEGIWYNNKGDTVVNGFIETSSDSRTVEPMVNDEVWPSSLTPSTPPPHLVIHTSSTSGLEPAPLSPPFLQRTPLHPLQGVFSGHPSQAISDYSPPGSPPRHLSQVSAARVAAGDKSPPPPLSPPSQSPSPPLLERSTSVESVVQLLNSIKITTAQCMVPSDRETVDQIVVCAWDEAFRAGLHNVHSIFSHETHCPPPDKVLALIHKPGADDGGLDGMSPAEVRCREAYVGLVYQVALEMIRQLHPVKGRTPVWASQCTTRSLIVPTYFPGHDLPSLVDVQDRVYASLMRGQLTNQLPNIKFLHQMKRPGGREVDFVDQVLIQELRREEPEWVDYSKDEMSVKEKMADSLLESLVDETANILNSITEKRRVR